MSKKCPRVIPVFGQMSWGGLGYVPRCAKMSVDPLCGVAPQFAQNGPKLITNFVQDSKWFPSCPINDLWWSMV